MSDYQTPPPAPPAGRAVRGRFLLQLWLGVVGYGLLNIGSLFLLPLLSGEGPRAGSVVDLLGIRLVLIPALLLALLVGAVAALTYYKLGWRGFAAGLLLGYLLMTIVSAGECNLFIVSSDNAPYAGGAINGFFLYPVIAVLLGPVLAVIGAVMRRRD